MTDGRLEGIVLKDRSSTYRDGSRAAWFKIKDRSLVRLRGLAFDRRRLVADGRAGVVPEMIFVAGRDSSRGTSNGESSSRSRR